MIDSAARCALKSAARRFAVDIHDEKDLFGDTVRDPPRAPLAERFLMPPFSVLNAREGEWQDRKRKWLALGIKSELGRENDQYNSTMAKISDGMAPELLDRFLSSGEATSVFDPVLCELAYRWFCPPSGVVIDPFAGGSVRGIVAAAMGLQYWGCDLRAEQLVANREQAAQILSKDVPQPVWVCGDARNELAQQADAPFGADFIFTCPPYFDLEIYSDLPEDLSNMTWSHFCSAYYDIIEKACRRLKNNRFACFVVGHVRHKTTGADRNLPGITVQCFERAGLVYYNEAILVTCVGSLPVRCGMMFEATRKLGKTHQNVLIFLKGDANIAAMRCRQSPVAPPQP